jgi:DNA-directed RNA polymerase subunit N (RpoN/RPB10)
MIIPVRCMNCGKVLADLWRYYEKRVAEVKRETGVKSKGPIYMDGSATPILTAEGQVLDELNLNRYCCRKHFLTHTDLNERV